MHVGEFAADENLGVDVGTQTDISRYDVGTQTDCAECYTVESQTDFFFHDACCSDDGSDDEEHDDEIDNYVNGGEMNDAEMKDDGGGDADDDGSLMGVVFVHTFVGHGRYTCKVVKDEAGAEQVVVECTSCGDDGTSASSAEVSCRSYACGKVAAWIASHERSLGENASPASDNVDAASCISAGRASAEAPNQTLRCCQHFAVEPAYS